MSLRQRFADYLRERRIRRCAQEIEAMRQVRAFAERESRRAWDDMAREIQMRSPEQVARMELAQGLRE